MMITLRELADFLVGAYVSHPNDTHGLTVKAGR